MSLEWAAAGYSDQDEGHVAGAACALPAIDFEQLEWKRNDLKDTTFSCQHVSIVTRGSIDALYVITLEGAGVAMQLLPPNETGYTPYMYYHLLVKHSDVSVTYFLTYDGMRKVIMDIFCFIL